MIYFGHESISFKMLNNPDVYLLAPTKSQTTYPELKPVNGNLTLAKNGTSLSDQAWTLGQKGDLIHWDRDEYKITYPIKTHKIGVQLKEGQVYSKNAKKESSTGRTEIG